MRLAIVTKAPPRGLGGLACSRVLGCLCTCVQIWALSAVASRDDGRVPPAVKGVAIAALVVLALCVVHALVRTRKELAGAGSGLGEGEGGSGGVFGADSRLGSDVEGAFDPRSDSERVLMLSDHHGAHDCHHHHPAGYAAKGAGGAAGQGGRLGAPGLGAYASHGYALDKDGAEVLHGKGAGVYGVPSGGYAALGAGASGEHGQERDLGTYQPVTAQQVVAAHGLTGNTVRAASGGSGSGARAGAGTGAGAAAGEKRVRFQDELHAVTLG